MYRTFLLVVPFVCVAASCAPCSAPESCPPASPPSAPPLDSDPSTEAHAFAESFDEDLGPNLEDADEAYLVDGGVRRNENVFRDNRHYVRTVRTDYVLADWTFELTVDTEAGGDISFVGLGQGIPNPRFFNEPGNAVFLRIHGPDIGAGRVDVSQSEQGGDLVQIAENIGTVQYGTHRVRLEKTGNSVVFSICASLDNCCGLPPTFSHTIDDVAAAAPYIDAENGHLFFGSGMGFGSFDDFAVE